MGRALVFLWLCLVSSCHGQRRPVAVPQTPCADIFDYRQDGNELYKGHLTVPAPAPRTTFLVEVFLYLDADVKLDNHGYINLTSGEDYNYSKIEAEEIEDIQYDIFFPIPNPLPEVDKITVNGKVICEGPPVHNPQSRLHLSYELLPPGSKTTTKKPPSSNECGLTVSSAPLVLGGTPTARGNWPWLAAIYVREDDSLPICGGSLINKRHVITAAHCIKHKNKTSGPPHHVVHNKDDLVVVLGKYQLSDRWERFTEIKNVEAIHIPEEYDAYNNYFSDIAVLVLQSPVQVYTEYIRPICMWKSDQNMRHVINKTGTVVGWGRTETEWVTNTPKKGTVFIVSRDDCIQSYTMQIFKTNNRTLCAGHRNGTGPCTGDSGGPLMVPVPRDDGSGVTWFLSGVVSMAFYDHPNDICNVREYTVYTDVVKFMTFLKPFTKEE